MVNPNGDKAINSQNNQKWVEALTPILVDMQTAKQVTGGGFVCSVFCLDEEEDPSNYRMLDSSRIKLANCPHFSFHI